jgi:hypothetical protein
MTNTPADLGCCSARRRLATAGLAYTPAALLAIFTPKCPMCLAALLGLGLALPGYSYALVVAGSALAGTLAAVVQLRRLWKFRQVRKVRRRGACAAGAVAGPPVGL